MATLEETVAASLEEATMWRGVEIEAERNVKVAEEALEAARKRKQEATALVAKWESIAEDFKSRVKEKSDGS